ncbi:cell division protein FtsI [filamentous cyanobacterium CCP5]|nr:cell division protein FtsI [filamentous cyanobacterium CCP5]
MISVLRGSQRRRQRRRRRPSRRPPRPPSEASLRRSSQPSTPWQPSRLRAALVWGVLVLAIVALGGRLAYLQIHQGASLAAIALQQQAQVHLPRSARRAVVDSQGNVVAMDGIVYELYAHPALFKQEIDQVAAAISPILETAPADLSDRLGRQDTGIKLSADLSEEQADRLRALRLDGLELLRKQRRLYPQEELFAPVVGFVNLEGEPQLGIELSMAEELALAPDTADVPEGTSGLAPRDYSLQLTLDGRLQRIAQQELAATVKEHGAKRGTLMVMDVHSGALQALAIAPTFNPNRYYEADVDQLKNWAVSDLYEPGSTFKPINVAIALEAGAIKADSTVYDSGQIRYGKWTIRNADYASVGGRGQISIGEVLAYSSNVGMIQIMNQLPTADYYNWLTKIELGQPTHIDLPAEATGAMKDRQQFIKSSVESATTAFGQGFVLTPMQLLRYQAAIANGGKLVTPHVVRGLVDSQQQLHWQPERPAPKAVFSAETAQHVLLMMENVVKDGTGQPAQLPNYRIAGKTGTAQKATANGTYGTGRITSFAAILPVEAPRYVVLAIIDEPRGENAYGSTVAAPLVKKMMESLLVLEGIPPAEPVE